MRDWGRVVIRSFGIANWVYGLIGSYLLVDGLRRANHFGPNPYEAKIYYFLVAVNALFLVAVFLAGYWLILIRRRGAILANYAFSLEICFGYCPPSSLFGLLCPVMLPQHILG